MHRFGRLFALSLAFVAVPIIVLAQSGAILGVPANYPYLSSVQYVINEKVMNGYADNLFRPDKMINRAELTKILIQAKGRDLQCQRENVRRYTDIPSDSWYMASVCRAATAKWLTSEGLFRPNDRIAFSEAAALIVRAYGIPIIEQQGDWYAPAIITLAERKAIPLSIASPHQFITRAEAAEIIVRMNENITDRPSRTSDDILGATCEWFTEESIPQVDLEEVKRTWLGWVNEARVNQGLPAYISNRQLDRTAFLWSKRSRDRGVMTHKRDGQQSYYDYNLITQWFENLGLTFKNVNRVTYTENIGYGPFSCTESDKDCTQKLINSIRTTFDFYMAEKGKANRSHYNSIMHSGFSLAGSGIAIDEQSKRYYITTHYGTEIESDPDPVCP